jgi:5'-deoxynucleotidase YfbR-like HD superfamily hydrolase
MNSWEEIIEASTTDIRRLSAVWRFSSIPVVAYENTAEHSFYVAVYAAMIHLEVSNDEGILGAVVMAALMHDVPEAVTGDVVRPFKYSSESLRKEINASERKLLGKMPWKVRQLFTVSDRMSTAEGPDGEEIGEYVEIVVKAADFLSLYQYMRREAAKGNLEIIPFYNRMVDDIMKMREQAPDNLGGFEVKNFYWALERAARQVREDSFHGLENNSNWSRNI